MLAWVMNLDFAASDSNAPAPPAPSQPSTLLMLMAGLLMVRF